MSVKRINQGGQTLPIKEFKLDSMVENPAIVLIAKRGSGKSWVCRSILKNFRSIPVGVIISPTEKMADPPFYSEFLPDTYVHYEYKTELIEKILYRQQYMIEKKKEKRMNENKTIDARAFILMDDCLSSKGSWGKDKPVMDLLYNGRHFQLMYILTMQFPLGIEPSLRLNFDYIFLLADDNVSNLKRLYDHYAGMFPNLEAFKQVFEQLTRDFGAMVIVNRGVRNNFLEKIYWFKAYDEKIGYIGCKQFIKNHEDNYDKNWRKRNAGIHMEDLIMKKKGNNFKINVDKVE
jgi:hypothetical protein